MENKYMTVNLEITADLYIYLKERADLQDMCLESLIEAILKKAQSNDPENEKLKAHVQKYEEHEEYILNNL